MDNWHDQHLKQLEEPDVCLRCEEEGQHGYCYHVLEAGE